MERGNAEGLRDNAHPPFSKNSPGAALQVCLEEFIYLNRPMQIELNAILSTLRAYYMCCIRPDKLIYSTVSFTLSSLQAYH